MPASLSGVLALKTSVWACCVRAGFLCNVREPYDQETLMPVYFNKTCNAEGSFDPETGLAINPLVDRPVDRARALYHKALGYLPDKLVTSHVSL